MTSTPSVGSSRWDATAARPKENPVTPEDVAATVYTLPGTDPTAALIDGQIKPYTLVHGKPVRGLV